MIHGDLLDIDTNRDAKWHKVADEEKRKERLGSVIKQRATQRTAMRRDGDKVSVVLEEGGGYDKEDINPGSVSGNERKKLRVT